ncbi:MAG: DOMON-like domain-containing protein [Nitrospirota bacterium]
MSSRSFALKPFPADGRCPDIAITGAVARRPHTLSVSCAITGPLSAIAVPEPGGVPGRKDRLWEETCLEFFLAAKNSGGYWEFNLSPSGHWNVYRFTAYRQGMREEPAFTSLPFSIDIEPDSLRLSLELDMGSIIPGDQALEVAVSAVIKTAEGSTTYWALTHPGPQPDFHRRDSFIIEL